MSTPAVPVVPSPHASQRILTGVCVLNQLIYACLNVGGLQCVDLRSPDTVALMRVCRQVRAELAEVHRRSTSVQRYVQSFAWVHAFLRRTHAIPQHICTIEIHAAQLMLHMPPVNKDDRDTFFTDPHQIRARRTAWELARTQAYPQRSVAEWHNADATFQNEIADNANPLYLHHLSADERRVVRRWSDGIDGGPAGCESTMFEYMLQVWMSRPQPLPIRVRRTVAADDLDHGICTLTRGCLLALSWLLLFDRGLTVDCFRYSKFSNLARDFWPDGKLLRHIPPGEWTDPLLAHTARQAASVYKVDWQKSLGARALMAEEKNKPMRLVTTAWNIVQQNGQVALQPVTTLSIVNPDGTVTDALVSLDNTPVPTNRDEME